MKLQLAGIAALLSASAAQAVVAPAIPFTVSLESEAPGIQNSRALFHAVGVERFEDVGTGHGQSFNTNFGGSAFNGTYTGIEVLGFDQYGGAGGTGQYAVTFNSSGYSLDLSTGLPGGVTYFGFWLSALDGGNNVTFFSGGNQLFSFSASDAKTFIDGLPSSNSYYCNPNANFATDNCHEPYAFLNFYARGGTTFDRIVFAENPEVGGYESDNHTVGQWKRMSGTVIPVAGTSTAVPEPASWLMLISGFGLVGAGMRRRRLIAA